MTVWIASQPMRGHLVEKSLFRVAGTISGTVIGVSLTAVSAGNPLILTLGLAIWISICTGIGNLQRGYIAYSTILAGYTAAMVSLLGSEQATSIVSVGFDRLLTVIVGVGVALIVSWIYAGRASTDLVLIQMRTITVQVLNLLASRLRHPARNIDKQVYELLRGISMIDDVLDSHGAGSLRSRRTVKSMRVLIASHISLLLWLKESNAVSKCDRLLAYVQETIEKLETGDLLTEVHDPRIAGFNPHSGLAAWQFDRRHRTMFFIRTESTERTGYVSAFGCPASGLDWCKRGNDSCCGQRFDCGSFLVVYRVGTYGLHAAGNDGHDDPFFLDGRPI
jgi:uncharacterized membrane protein YccC